MALDARSGFRIAFTDVPVFARDTRKVPFQSKLERYFFADLLHREYPLTDFDVISLDFGKPEILPCTGLRLTDRLPLSGTTGRQHAGTLGPRDAMTPGRPDESTTGRSDNSTTGQQRDGRP